MKPLTRGMLVLIATAFLVQCQPDTQTETDTPPADVTSAVDGIEWSVRLVRGIADDTPLRPSAILGLYVSSYMLHISTFQGALAGIEAQMQLLFDEEYEKSESFALLEELGSILQVDVIDMLNRSQSRPRAFDAYIDGLIDIMRTSEAHTLALEQELEEINDERREKRKVASDIQRELNEALREQDYSTAGDRQQRLITAEGDLATVEAREDEKRDVINLFDELLDVGEERLNAMEANREAIIAGIMVTELPGVDDLGLIKEGNRRGGRSRESGLNAPLIDPNL